MKKPVKKFPWETARQREREDGDEYEARLDRLFIEWVNQRIAELERVAEARADPFADIARENNRDHHRAVSAELLLPSRKPKLLAALAIKDVAEKIATLGPLLRDQPSVRFALEHIFREHGGQKGRVVKAGQRQYSEDERELLRDMVADVRTIRLIIKKHGIRKPRVSPEAIAAERAAGSREGWSMRKWTARKEKMFRDLTNHMKNL